MKIESRGFRVADICPQVPMIDVDGEGTVRLFVNVSEGRSAMPTDYLSREQLEALREAIDAILARLGDEHGAASEKREASPGRVEDKSGDVWILVHDAGYVIEGDAKDHEDCVPQFCDAGRTLEYVETHWGPIKRLD